MSQGFEVARKFCKYGARVIMINRKEDQGEASIKQIKEESGPDTQIEWKQCDLGSLKMVKEVFGQLEKELDRLDYVSVIDGIRHCHTVPPPLRLLPLLTPAGLSLSLLP